MKNPSMHSNLRGKTIFWKWKGDEGPALLSEVLEDLGEIIVVSGGFDGKGLNLPRAEITIIKSKEAHAKWPTPKPWKAFRLGEIGNN